VLRRGLNSARQFEGAHFEYVEHHCSTALRTSSRVDHILGARTEAEIRLFSCQLSWGVYVLDRTAWLARYALPSGRNIDGRIPG
jgi:hypothetical protein